MHTILWTGSASPALLQEARRLDLNLHPVRLFQPAPVAPELLQAALRADAGFDTVLVASEAGAQALRLLHPLLGAPRVVAAGEAAAAVLRSEGLPVVRPDEPDADGIRAALLIEGAKQVLYLRGPKPYPGLTRSMAAAGIRLEQAPAYRMLPAEDVPLPDQFEGVVFRTPASVDAFFGLPEATLAFDLPCFAAGGEVADTLRDFGIPTIVTTDARQARHLLLLVAEYFRDRAAYRDGAA